MSTPDLPESGTGATGEQQPAQHADVAQLGYEAARDELATVVARLESGEPSLEDSMRLWERGEALATHCQKWLADAEQRIDAMTSDRD